MEFGLILKHHLGIMKNQFLETLYSRFLPSEFIYSQHLAALLKIPEAHVKTMLLHELGDGQLMKPMLYWGVVTEPGYFRIEDSICLAPVKPEHIVILSAYKLRA
jgi:hypothetical protein